RGLRGGRARRRPEAGRPAGRHLHHHQRRHLRLADVDPDRQSAAVRDPGHAHHQGAPDRRERPGGGGADDVHRAVLRPPHHRRQGRGAVPGRHQEPAREPRPHAAGPVSNKETDMAEEFDVVVIGAGPAGYHAAIRAAQLGMSVACVDAGLGKDGKPALGGTCLRVGCIPSKALLDSSRQFHNLQTTFEQHGISATDPQIDVEKMVGRKDAIVKQFTGGIAMLFKANKVKPYYGFATLHADRVVKVKQHEGGEVELKGTNVIIAAGSDSIELPFAKFDGEYIVDNVGALDFKETPKRLAVIGAGVIGLELGSVWRRLGAEVTILEAMPEFLAAADAEVSKVAAREFKKQGLDIRLGAKVSKAEVIPAKAGGKGKKKEVQ